MSTPSLPSSADVQLAQQALQTMRTGTGQHLSVGDSSHALPPVAARLLMEVLEILARGNAVQVTAVSASLTTQQAADLLGVSRPFLIQQIDAGRLACYHVGTHRRLHLTDVVAYQRDMHAQRKVALDALAELTPE